jgi:hypothetical protein
MISRIDALAVSQTLEFAFAKRHLPDPQRPSAYILHRPVSVHRI